MNNTTADRRRFIQQSTLALAALSTAAQAQSANGKLHFASNQYSWQVFYQRENQNFMQEADKGLEAVASCGLHGFEGNASTPGDVVHVAPLLKKHNLEMLSLYVNSVLHEADQAKDSIQTVVDIAKEATKIGTTIIVTNPSPIRWGGGEAKTDGQLQVQARALNDLGKRLGDLGVTLAYHNHDAEMKHSAREFHHMMLGTDPQNVALCLDSHWVYRGADDSQVALFDIVKLYGSRIVELHLRQSHDSVWSETLCEGDIDYARLAQALLAIASKPHLVLEIAVEKGTPHTLSPVEAHKQSLAFAQTIFAKFN